MLRTAALVCLSLTLVAPACSNVETRRDPAFDLSTIETYAWERGPRIIQPPNSPSEQALLERVETEVEDELALLGLRRVAAKDADAWVSAKLVVETDVYQSNRQFTLYVAERVEIGRLIVELHEPETEVLIWRGEISDRLRFVARSMGGANAGFVPTGQARDWDIRRMIDRVLAEFADARRDSRR